MPHRVGARKTKGVPPERLDCHGATTSRIMGSPSSSVGEAASEVYTIVNGTDSVPGAFGAASIHQQHPDATLCHKVNHMCQLLATLQDQMQKSWRATKLADERAAERKTERAAVFEAVFAERLEQMNRRINTSGATQSIGVRIPDATGPPIVCDEAPNLINHHRPVLTTHASHSDGAEVAYSYAGANSVSTNPDQHTEAFVPAVPANSCTSWSSVQAQASVPTPHHTCGRNDFTQPGTVQRPAGAWYVASPTTEIGPRYAAVDRRHKHRRLIDLPPLTRSPEDRTRFDHASRNTTQAFGFENVKTLVCLSENLSREAKHAAESPLVQLQYVARVMRNLRDSFGLADLGSRSQIERKPTLPQNSAIDQIDGETQTMTRALLHAVNDCDQRLPKCTFTRKCVVYGCTQRNHAMLLHDRGNETLTSGTTFSRDTRHRQLPAEAESGPRRDGGEPFRTSTGAQPTTSIKYAATDYGPAEDQPQQDRMFETIDLAGKMSSVRLIENSVADLLGLDDSATDSSLKWFGRHSTVLRPRKLTLRINRLSRPGEQYAMIVRTISNELLPARTVDTEMLFASNPHLREAPLEQLCRAVPRVLIGLDNYPMGIPLEVRADQDEDVLVIERCKLDWTVYKSEGPAYLLNAMVLLVDGERDEVYALLNKVVRSFTMSEDFGVRTQQAIIECDDDTRARSILVNIIKRIGERFDACLLWRRDYVNLPLSYVLALRKLANVKERVRHESLIAEPYVSQITMLFHRVRIRAEIQSTQTFFLYGDAAAGLPIDVYVMEVTTLDAKCLLEAAELNGAIFELAEVRWCSSTCSTALTTAYALELPGRDGCVSISRAVLEAAEVSTGPGDSVHLESKSTSENIFGMLWNTADDNFRFRTRFTRAPEGVLDGTKRPTRHSMLSSCVMLSLEFMVPGLCHTEFDWTEPAVDEIWPIWIAWRLKISFTHWLRFAEANKTAFAAAKVWLKLRVDMVSTWFPSTADKETTSESWWRLVSTSMSVTNGETCMRCPLVFDPGGRCMWGPEWRRSGDVLEAARSCIKNIVCPEEKINDWSSHLRTSG